MLDIAKLERIKVDFIDYAQINGRYKNEYQGKLIIDQYGNVSYCSKDGTIISVLMYACDFGSDGKFETDNFINNYSQNSYVKNKENISEKLTIEQLTHLKASGHSTEEIIRLKNEGVI